MMFVLVALVVFLVIAGGSFLRRSRLRSAFSLVSHFFLFYWFGKRSRSQCYGCCQYHDGPATLFIAWHGDRSMHALPE